MKEEVEVRRSFDVVVPIKNLLLKEKMLLCNAFDGYEVVRNVSDIVVVDTLGFDSEKFLIKVTLLKPLTYKEIHEVVCDIFKYIYEKTGVDIDINDIGIRWDVREFGKPSSFFNQELFESDEKRKMFFQNLSEIKEEKGKGFRKYDLEKGCSYMIREKVPKKSFDIFVDYVTHDFMGLCITRMHPEKVKKNYKLKKTPILWLSQLKDNLSIHPNDLVELSRYTREFVTRIEKTIILLHGLEYLITQNNFDVILKLIQNLNDQVVATNSILLVPTNPKALSLEQLSILESELKSLEI